MRRYRLSPDPALHSSATLADADSFAPLNVRNTTGNLPPLEEKPRKWRRRAFLLVGAAVLGVGGSGLGYAAYRAYIGKPLNTNSAKKTLCLRLCSSAARPRQPNRSLLFLRWRRLFLPSPIINRWSVLSPGLPDGTLLASGSDDAHVFIWNPNGTVQHDIPHPGSVQSLAWSPDQQRL